MKRYCQCPFSNIIILYFSKLICQFLTIDTRNSANGHGKNHHKWTKYCTKKGAYFLMSATLYSFIRQMGKNRDEILNYYSGKVQRLAGCQC